MPELVSRRAALRLAAAVDTALVVSLILVTTAAPGAVPVASRGPRIGVTSPASSGPGAGLTIDPPSFWMRSGENVTLRASWWTDSAVCPVSPLWFVWSVTKGSATGFLNATTGPSVVFTAYSLESGSVEVQVRSAASQTCSSNTTLVERSNLTEVTIVTPLDLFDVQTDPTLLAPGGVATLNGSITGGAPPYLVNVVWGDGTRTTFDLGGPGNFSVNHTFAPGAFVPYVVASDSESDVQNRSVAEAISVGSGFRVTVAPSTFIAEVGIPLELTGLAVDAPAASVVLYDCTNASVDSPSGGSSVPNATDFSCTFQSAGPQEVLFGVYPSNPGGPSASAVLYETVVAPPVLGVVPVANVGEVGHDALLMVSLHGGAPPISLAWNLTGNRSAGSEVVSVDGTGVLELPLLTPGDYALGVRATDRFGATEANGTVTLQVDAPLEIHAVVGRFNVTDGVLVRVVGEVLSGCPPFSWWAIPQFPATNESWPSGLLATDGSFGWNGTYVREGSAAFLVVAVDACGTTWQTALSEELVAPLVAQVSAAPDSSSPNDTLVVTVSVQDGWAPYLLFANATDNQSWNRSLPSPGTYRFDWVTDANGSLSLVATLVDGLGAAVASRLTVMWPASGPPPSPPPPPTLPEEPNATAAPGMLDGVGLFASFAVLMAVSAGLAVFWRRHARKRKAKPTEVDPVAVLNRIIAPADGAERFTVELLAEQEGISLEVVRSTIDRLIADGKVRSESGADGEEVLSWVGRDGH